MGGYSMQVKQPGKEFRTGQQIDLHPYKDTTLKDIYTQFSINPDIHVIILRLEGGYYYPATQAFENYTLKTLEEKVVTELNARYTQKFGGVYKSFVAGYMLLEKEAGPGLMQCWDKALTDANAEGESVEQTRAPLNQI